MADNKSFIHIDLPIGDFGNVDLCDLMLCQRVHRKDKKDVVFDLVKE